MTTTQFESSIGKALRALGIDPTARIGVALSGGADSVALLTALHRTGHSVVALHCDFSLRGEESDGDRRYCGHLAEKLGVELRAVKFDTKDARRQGESIEMACRRLRYDWFEEQAKELSLTAIALGHHCEDSLETMMLNFTRGSGPKGVSGIAPRRGIYIRPMLDLTRTDIEEYLAQLGTTYRTDSSNLTNDYRRNTLRNTLLPLLYELIPTARAGLLQTAEAMRHSDNMISTYLAWCADRYCSIGKINIDGMRAGNIDMEGTLYRLIPQVTGHDVAMEVVTQILAEPDNRASRLFPAAEGTRLELYAGHLEAYTEPDATEYEITLDCSIDRPIPLSITTVSYDEFASTPKSNDTLWLDGSITDTPHRFVLRHRREGDRIRPFGSRGSRLVSDIFTDLKMSRSAKNSTFILTVDGTPVWIVGKRAAEMYRVTESSKKVIKLQLL
ncbi:MAG: tRNA lysidine(34) synthetase TilS [Muribaculaceae bacterium]|nr:tRNA lysidine(34) synthetase TilS [Muribaculaceae bacterium]